MIFKETGFRPLYHYVCAFELNDTLRKVIKDCPDAEKASHMVAYGYIDPDEGLMLEVLGAGKQAPKYFYFKEPYQGERISLHVSEVESVDFCFFPKLEPRFYKKYLPRIEELKKYDASEQVEESRKFAFLDSCRSNEYPDDVEVLLLKKGLKKEKVWVTITGLGDHCIVGKLLNEPFQEFGISEGESITFYVRTINDTEDQVECYLDFDPEPKISITAEELKDGSLLKKLIKEVKEKNDKELFAFLLAVLRSSRVTVPCEIEFDDNAQKILDSHDPDKDFTEEEFDVISAGTTFIPNELRSDSEIAFPVYTSKNEIGNRFSDSHLVEIPFIGAIDLATEQEDYFNCILINVDTESFIINKELFEIIKGLKPLFSVDESVSISVPHDNESFTKAIPLQGQNSIYIHVAKMDVFNYALYHNDIEPIRGIQIENKTGSPIDGAIIKISSDVNIFKPFEAIIPSLPSGEPVNIADPQISINGAELASLTETINADITIEILSNNKTLTSISRKMKILAYDQWQGSLSYRDLLPAFVLPNHPEIIKLLQEVSLYLKKQGKSVGLEGYQRNDVTRVKDFAEAAFEVIKSKSIVYANPPASFLINGQRIRTPDEISDQKLGTCMDMTLLYASLLEAIGLHPILILLKNHIFAAYWLHERSNQELQNSDLVIEDQSIVIKLISGGANEISLLECTQMCAGKDCSFEQASSFGRDELLDSADDFSCAIDVFIARINGVLPIPSRIKTENGFKLDSQSSNNENNTQKVIESSVSNKHENKSRKINNKIDLWESKLLDLSNRNMLLNLPKTSAVLPIMSNSIAKLEDALSDGNEFSIFAVPNWILGISRMQLDKNGNPTGKSESWLTLEQEKKGTYEITDWPANKDFDAGEMIRQEYKKHRLYSFLDKNALERSLTTIYRSAKKSQQENGVSSLYLAIGLLKWHDEDTKQSYYAPLVLMPVELLRKSASLGYALRLRDEEPHFNSTLIEMLKQNYALDLSVLDSLPNDEHGVDINKVLSTVRSSVFSIKNWEVIETCVLGNFSFAQFAMWNDIHTAREKLNNSKLVRSLIKGHLDWDLNTNNKIEKLYLPISADDTQQKAIQMAAEGKTFVLHGPPGTGKSQTITNMIANLMAQGKTVLFVAEKEAALKVVKDRLALQVGIGDFCLALHSNKTDKKLVLASFDNVLKRESTSITDFAEYTAKTQILKSKLDEYAEHLHQVHNSGYSLRTLVALYETVRDCETYIPFDRDSVNGMSKEMIKTHIPLIEQLIEAGKYVDNIANNPFRDIGLKAYDSDVRSHLRQYSTSYSNALKEAQNTGLKVANIIGVSEPKNQSDLNALASLIKLFNDNKTTKSIFAKLRGERAEEVRCYLEQRESVQRIYNWLLQYWKPELLTQDMNTYLIKYNAASKRLLGRSNAQEAVANEMRVYALFGFTHDQIPELIKTINYHQENVKKLTDYYNGLSDETKSLLVELPDLDSYQKAVKMAEECEKKAAEFPGGIEAITRLAKDESNSEMFKHLFDVISCLEKNERQFNELLERKEKTEGDNWFEEEINFCGYVSDNFSELKTWGAYNSVRQDCYQAGLKPVVSAYEEGMDPSIIVDAYRKGLYYALIYTIIDNDDVLSCFSGSTFTSTIEQFKKLDEKLLTQTKNEIAYLLSKNIPTSTDSPEIGMELNLLRKAIGSNARGMTIRALFERIPNILPRLFPCMLMSPNSVAQYLEQKENMFDVVIFDEASQLPTCKAVGSLYRAKDAVVVGDPKQMPPTSFFSGAGPEVDDFALEDLDSILDDAIALGIPSQYLQWHYRSTHESLIAFSNKTFYGNQMYTFPSANDRENHVKTIFVGGEYKNNTNIKEAEAIVEEVVKRVSNPELKSQSIGIVTFNIKQMELIENLLAKQCQNNPELDSLVNDDERFFVKNLENVQGDERDVIIFSICYGPDEKGHISNNFGPINREGGGKRLNVAFSRSKVEMIIYTSMHSSDIKVADSSPDGVKAFYTFLKYAEDGTLSTEKTKNINRIDLSSAGILKSICSELDKHGYKYETMVGKSDFRVDIAVIDPYDESNYMLGIMLDGEGYRMIKNTRDREVAQLETLHRLGWNLCRVWTIDWLDNREKEINKLLDLVESLSTASREAYERKQAEEEARKEVEQQQADSVEQLREEIAQQAKEVLNETENEVSE